MPTPNPTIETKPSNIYSSAALIACLACLVSLATSYGFRSLFLWMEDFDDSVSDLVPIDSDVLYREAFGLWPKSKSVDRVPFSEMTHAKFIDQYMVHRRPVVIVDMYANNPLTEGVNDKEWGWEGMKRRFGHVKLETRILGGFKGCTSTGLCEGRTITIKELFDRYFLNKRKNQKKVPYPHDIQLETVLPEMFQVYQKHAFFAENLLLPVNSGTDRWPSLFFGARGTQTNLHVDNMGTSFTMAVFRGRKQFMMIDSNEGDKLCMNRPNKGLHYGVGEDPFKPDFDRCPSAKQATALFADVNAGDILYVPGSFHHAARNLEDSVGISQNFLTVQDYNSVVESFAGYVPKLERKKKDQLGQNKPAKVTLDFLSMRDMYRLLAETGYRSNWRDGKQWWNANEATVEAHNRIMTHMESVVKNASVPMKMASRLAYLINARTMMAALKAAGAWDCLETNGGRDIILGDPNTEPVVPNMLSTLEKAFKLNADVHCQSLYKVFYNEIEAVSLPNAVQTIGKEQGLSRHCC